MHDPTTQTNTTAPTQALSQSALLDAIRSCLDKSDHGIPHYAYGDNQAACEMHDRLDEIRKELGVVYFSLANNEDAHAKGVDAL